MLEAALQYARLGWRIFPIWWVENGKCACGWKPKDITEKHPIGKHPISKVVPQGLLNAQSAVPVISYWWTKFPNANIGIVTGRVNNIFVVDIDPRHNGDESLVKFESENGSIIPDDYTGKVITGSGGYHYYYRYPKEMNCQSKTNLLPGIDIKADGGYVIAPPSTHASGGKYEWEI